MVHLSAGDLLRDEVASGSDMGKQLNEIMKEGKLVPVSVTIGLLKKAMIKSGGKTFLIDGFPRYGQVGQALDTTLGQGQDAQPGQPGCKQRGERRGKQWEWCVAVVGTSSGFHTCVIMCGLPVGAPHSSRPVRVYHAQILALLPPCRAQDQADVFEKDIAKPKAVLFFECTEEEMEKRLLKRGETSGRADDNAETIRKRFKTFVEQSLPVKGVYEGKGLAHVINSAAPIDDVFAEVKKALDTIGLPKKAKAAPKEEAAPAKTEAPALVVPEVPGSIPADASIIFVLGEFLGLCARVCVWGGAPS